MRPPASLVLSCHLRQRGLPPWTSYFVRYWNVQDDQRGQSHFNWPLDGANYHVLRTGCFPYIKYHCSRRQPADLSGEDCAFRLIKLINLGVPCLVYGVAALLLIRHCEMVATSQGTVPLYFLYKEDVGAQY